MIIKSTQIKSNNIVKNNIERVKKVLSNNSTLLSSFF